MTGSVFKLDKTSKRMMALTFDKAKASMLKKIFIEGKVAETAARMQKYKMKDTEES